MSVKTKLINILCVLRKLFALTEGELVAFELRVSTSTTILFFYGVEGSCGDAICTSNDPCYDLSSIINLAHNSIYMNCFTCHQRSP